MYGGVIGVLLVTTLTSFSVASAQTVEMRGLDTIPTSGEMHACLKVDSDAPTFTTPDWEGYEGPSEWLDGLRAARAEYEGYADSAIETYKNYISEEEISSLRELEQKATTAHSFANLEEHKAALEEIVQSVAAKVPAKSAVSSYSGNWSGAFGDFMRAGVINYGGNKYTYYSQSVLPGTGLNIPGRHLDGGFVKDGDGYIVIANDAPKGTVVDTPFGAGKVYDRGTYGNHMDIYVQ